MKPRNTLIVVALFAILLAYVYTIELNKTPEQLGTPVPTAQPQVLSVTASNVKSIEVRDLRGSRLVQLTKSDNNWQVMQPVAKPADTAEVDTTLNDIASLQASRVLTNVTSIANYGFNAALLEVRLVMSDTTQYALTVGDKTPDGNSYYAVYTGDKSKVFIISSSTVTTLNDWLTTPPYQPTATPTATATPPVTPTVASTETITGTPTVASPSVTNPTVAPPNIAPTVAVPPPVTTTPTK